MQFVPWKNIADWHCKGCGYCCKLYSVVLSFPEWLNLTKTFGVETTVASVNRFFIKRVSDGSCSFLCRDQNNYYCALQDMKPEACKIWPFKVLTEPKYGDSSAASYDYRGMHLYVYGDAMCSGLRLGEPTWDFKNSTVKEFTEIALGARDTQHNSTRGNTQQWGRRLFP